MSDIQPTRVLDARGLACPMPIVKTNKEMKELAQGQILQVIATDRGAIADFPAWADDTGNVLVSWKDNGDGTLVFFLMKATD
jgi:TusA-related sulfurtransferase